MLGTGGFLLQQFWNKVVLMHVKLPEYNLCLSLIAAVYADASRLVSTKPRRRGTCSTTPATFSPICSLAVTSRICRLPKALSLICSTGPFSIHSMIGSSRCLSCSLSRVTYYCSAFICLVEECVSCILWILHTYSSENYIFVFKSKRKRGYMAPKFSNLDQLTTWMVFFDCHF
jgi:hypothetical protein